MNYTLHYCSNCLNHVEPKEEGFCFNCGHVTNDAVTFECVLGHKMSRWDKFCKVCGRIGVEPHENEVEITTKEPDDMSGATPGER